MHVNCGQMDSGTLPGYKWEFGQNQDVFFYCESCILRATEGLQKQ